MTNTIKNAQFNELTQKSNTLFLFHSFSSSHILSGSWSLSYSLSLNTPQNFIHSSMIYLPHIAEAFQHILWTQNKLHDAKVSVNMISEKTKYIPKSFHTSYEVRYLPNLLGEKFTNFLLFSSLSLHHSHPFCSSQPQLPPLFKKNRKVIRKHTPWKKEMKKTFKNED